LQETEKINMTSFSTYSIAQIAEIVTVTYLSDSELVCSTQKWFHLSLNVSVTLQA